MKDIFTVVVAAFGLCLLAGCTGSTEPVAPDKDNVSTEAVDASGANEAATID